MSFLQQARTIANISIPVEKSNRGHIVTPYKNKVRKSVSLARQTSIGLQMYTALNEVSYLPTEEESFMFKVARITPESKYSLVKKWLDITDENIAQALQLGELYDKYLTHTVN